VHAPVVVVVVVLVISFFSPKSISQVVAMASPPPGKTKKTYCIIFTFILFSSTCLFQEYTHGLIFLLCHIFFVMILVYSPVSSWSDLCMPLSGCLLQAAAASSLTFSFLIVSFVVVFS